MIAGRRSSSVATMSARARRLPALVAGLALADGSATASSSHAAESATADAYSTTLGNGVGKVELYDCNGSGVQRRNYGAAAHALGNPQCGRDRPRRVPVEHHGRHPARELQHQPGAALDGSLPDPSPTTTSPISLTTTP